MRRKIYASLFILTAVILAGLTEPVSGETVQYEFRGKRDPFVPLVGMDRPTVTKLEDISSVDDIKLEGIAFAGGKRIALLNGEVLKEGDRVGDVEMKAVANKFVTISISGKSYDIYLPGEEGGSNSGK